ncbi:MAG: phosphotransferase [Anaerolineae bacterium]|jgi:aminoglycoside phosphotransferase (APT) family kinase protein
MAGFDPNEHRVRCEQYLSHHLGSPVRLLRAERLQKSTRDAPWRLDVDLDGTTRSYVLRLDSRNIEHELEMLHAMAPLPIPAPRAYGWDPEGRGLGMVSFFYDFVEGESLLEPMLAGEPWAEALYIDTACALQSIRREQLSTVNHRLGEGQTAADVLHEAYTHFGTNPPPLARAVYTRLLDTMPALPEVRFSNGDLWPDNLIVHNGRLAGVIDWTWAGFSDPIFEFLLPFFLRPALRGRGIEARYCKRMGFDPELLPWYHGLELFDSWRWVLHTGQPYEQHTAESLQVGLGQWLEGPISWPHIPRVSTGEARN